MSEYTWRDAQISRTASFCGFSCASSTIFRNCRGSCCFQIGARSTKARAQPFQGLAPPGHLLQVVRPIAAAAWWAGPSAMTLGVMSECCQSCGVSSFNHKTHILTHTHTHSHTHTTHSHTHHTYRTLVVGVAPLRTFARMLICAAAPSWKAGNHSFGRVGALGTPHGGPP